MTTWRFKNIKRKIKSQKLIDILILSFFSIVILHKTGFSGIINKTDFHFPIYPSDGLLKSLFVWNDFVTGFFDIPNILKIWPRNILASLLFLFTDVSIVQRIYLFLLFLGLSYSGYYLIYTILSFKSDDYDRIRLCSLIAGIFFLYNPFIFFRMNGGQFEYLYSLMGMNFVYAFLLKFATERQYRYLTLAALATTFIFSSTYSGIFLGVIFLVLIFLLFITIKRDIIVNLQLLTLIFLLNAFVVLPLIIFVLNPYSTSTEIREISLDVLRHRSSHDLVDILRLWVPNVENRFLFHPEWREYFSSIPIVILGLGLFTLSLISLLTKNKDKFIIFSSINLILFLNLTFGLKSALFSFLWYNFPFFIVFRDPSKFYQIILIHFSVLLAYTLYYIFRKVRKEWSIFLSLLLIFLIIINVRPMISGNLEGNLSPVNYPSDYFIVKKQIEKDKTLFRILILPQTWSAFKCGYYTWHRSYDFVSPFDLIFQRTVIDMKPLPRGSLESGIMIKLKFIENPIPYENFFNIMNIKYILIHHDLIDSQTQKVIKYKYYNDIINNEDIKFIFRSKNIDVLKYNNSKPRIYVTNKVIMAGKDQVMRILNLETSLFPVVILKDLPNEVSKYFAKGVINQVHCSIKVQDGHKKPFKWSKLSENSYNYIIEARYYIGKKSVIRTDEKEPENTLSFPSLKDCLYKFSPHSPTGWKVYNSTLIFIKTGSKPLKIDKLLENRKPIKGIVGIWWKTGWIGIGKRPIKFPVVIPPYQKAIIQINHIIKGNITICSLDLINLTKLNEIKTTSAPTITFKRVNPTKYIISVENATKPFFLVFSESYHPKWKLYIENKPTNFAQIIAQYPKFNVKEARHKWYKFTPQDISYLFKKPLPEKYHFLVNGYANAWYIDPKEIGSSNFTITLYFWPQSLFYLGLFISGTTFLACIGYLIYDWKK